MKWFISRRTIFAIFRKYNKVNSLLFSSQNSKRNQENFRKIAQLFVFIVHVIPIFICTFGNNAHEKLLRRIALQTAYN